MPRELSILVVANRTAMSAALEETMHARALECPATFTLVIPVGRGLEGRRAVHEMEAHMRQTGLEVHALAGDPDPLRAVLEAHGEFRRRLRRDHRPRCRRGLTWRWTRSGLLRRIDAGHTGALVRHVEASEMPPQASHPDGESREPLALRP